MLNRSLRLTVFLFVLSITLIYNSIIEAKVLKIVTTTSDLASITNAITGDHAEITSICSGKEDPHFLQAKPGYILLARDADLWIRIGMDLEIGWEGPVIEGSRNRKIQVGSRGHLDVSDFIIPLEVPNTRVSRAMGDVHPHGNPHYWLDPLNGRLIATAISDRLIVLDSQNSELYTRNLEVFKKALDERMFGEALVKKVGGSNLWTMQMNGRLEDYLHDNNLEDQIGGWLGLMKTNKGKEIVVYHRSWIYFSDRFNLTISAELEPKPGIPPSPSHLVKVIEKVRDQGIRLILLEPFYSHKAADKVAQGTGARVFVCPNSVGGHPEAYDYLSLIELIVNRLHEIL